MKISTENMTDSNKKKVYHYLNYDFINQEYTRQVYYPRENCDSNNSYMFSKNKEKNQPDTESKDDKKNILKEIFCINSDKFDSAFKEAIGGSGQEWKKITTMTSSSLCALLCFYNVEEKPITIKNKKYDKVLFEVQNKVIDGRNPSNVDIVLISKESKTILFLESKFMEYLTKGKSNKISVEYKKLYKELNIESLYDITNEENDSFKLSSRYENHYVDGIKQMISHYIGVCNFIKCKKSIDNRLELNGYKVILGGILFGNLDDDSLEKYNNAYKNLIGLLKKHNPNPKELSFLEEIITYQEIFGNYPLDEKVKKYYKL